MTLRIELKTPERHHRAEETALVHNGEGVIRVGDEEYEIRPGSVQRWTSAGTAEVRDG